MVAAASCRPSGQPSVSSCIRAASSRLILHPKRARRTSRDSSASSRRSATPMLASWPLASRSASVRSSGRRRSDHELQVGRRVVQQVGQHRAQRQLRHAVRVVEHHHRGRRERRHFGEQRGQRVELPVLLQPALHGGHGECSPCRWRCAARRQAGPRTAARSSCASSVTQATSAPRSSQRRRHCASSIVLPKPWGAVTTIAVRSLISVQRRSRRGRAGSARPSFGGAVFSRNRDATMSLVRPRGGTVSRLPGDSCESCGKHSPSPTLDGGLRRPSDSPGRRFGSVTAPPRVAGLAQVDLGHAERAGGLQDSQVLDRPRHRRTSLHRGRQPAGMPVRPPRRGTSVKLFHVEPEHEGEVISVLRARRVRQLPRYLASAVPPRPTPCRAAGDTSSVTGSRDRAACVIETAGPRSTRRRAAGREADDVIMFSVNWASHAARRRGTRLATENWLPQSSGISTTAAYIDIVFDFTWPRLTASTHAAACGARRSFHGISCSSCAARRNSVASSPVRAVNSIPIGNPSAVQCSGSDMEGCPVTFATIVYGHASNTGTNASITFER